MKIETRFFAIYIDHNRHLNYTSAWHYVAEALVDTFPEHHDVFNASGVCKSWGYWFVGIYWRRKP